MTVEQMVRTVGDYELGVVVDTLSMIQEDLHVPVGEVRRALRDEEDRREMAILT